MSKRAKEIRIYQDSSDNDVKILETTQGSGAPGILQSTTSSRPAKIAVAAYSIRRDRYNYRYDSNTEDGEEEFFDSPLTDNNEKDLSDVEVVENPKPKSQRRRVGTARGRVSATPESSAKRTSVRSTNKHQSHILTTPLSSNERISVSSANK